VYDNARVSGKVSGNDVVSGDAVVLW